LKDADDDKDKDDGGDPKANLIVNYLPASVSEIELKTLFERFGTIKSIKVVRDRFTASSLGYGFVKFDTPENALNAVAALNGYQIENKKLKVSVARPNSREITRSNLYISGLPTACGETELAEMMSAYGKVIESRILVDPTSKQPRGVGFCRFDTHENALAAISALNGSAPMGGSTKLNVKLADPPKDFKKKIPGYGPMAGGGGYRYNPMGYQLGMYQAYGTTGLGRTGTTGGTTGTKQPYPGVCLFIYHLTPDCTEHTLQQLFSNYGTVLSAKVMKDLTSGRNKGFGFVNMMNDQQAQLAISSLNGYQMGNKFLKVAYKK